MKKFKFLIVMLLLVLVCGLAACGPRAVNRDKAFEKVKEFLAEKYKTSEGNVLLYENVWFVEITDNGTITRDEVIGDVCFRIRLTYNGTRQGNLVIYYDASEDIADWGSQAKYEEFMNLVKEKELKGVHKEIKGAEGQIE